jgi:DNA-binding MurR/RpiR family transcriptional regulator
MDFDGVCGRIEERFGGFSPQLKKAARYAVARPEEVALNSLRAVATKAGVHPSTLVRLARELAFNGYNDFREPFRSWLRDRHFSFSDRARKLRRRGREAEALVGEMLARDLTNLQTSFAAIGVDRLTEARRLLSESRRIFVCGLRSLYPIAFYFHYACRMFMDKTILLTGQGGTFADDLRRVSADDALFAFSYAPYARDTMKAVRFARERKARIIAVTDSPLAAAARGATVALVVSNVSPSFFPSLVPAISVVQTLVALLIAQAGPDSLADLANSERQLKSFNVFGEDG